MSVLRCLRRPALFFLVAVFFLAGGVFAQTPPSVVVLRPAEGEPIFGETEIELQVASGGFPVTQVEVFFDNVRVAVLERPPWRVLVDAGQKNVPHNIEAVVQDGSGASSSTTRRTAVVQVDDEIDVDLMQLYVTLERGGQRVTDLQRDSFTVLDDGVPQEIISFERGEVPFTAVLLLDASASMTGDRLRRAVDGARSFVQSMNRLDEAKVVLFSDQVRRETPFTSVPSILTLSLGEVQADGGTALNDALYLGLKRLEGKQGRKVLVLLSDGVDVESVLPMQRVRDIVRRNQVVLYWLRLRREGENDGEGPAPQYYSAWRDAEGHQTEIDQLRQAVLESGGRIEPLDSMEQVKARLDAVLRELREQYVIGYYPSVHNGPGSFHKLELRLRNGNGVRIRTQEGYLEK